MSLYDVLMKYPGVQFKKVRGQWHANFGETTLMHKDLGTLAEMVAEAQERGYE